MDYSRSEKIGLTISLLALILFIGMCTAMCTYPDSFGKPIPVECQVASVLYDGHTGYVIQYTIHNKKNTRLGIRSCPLSEGRVDAIWESIISKHFYDKNIIEQEINKILQKQEAEVVIDYFDIYTNLNETSKAKFLESQNSYNLNTKNDKPDETRQEVDINVPMGEILKQEITKGVIHSIF